jgi:L-ascorbate metabolism protein UlaG (beta-lactamase superfamily)
MRLTKHAHACVRIELGDVCVVLDPGVFTDAAAVDGATAVLVTHEHPDHLHPDNLRATDAPIWTIGAVADQITAAAPDLAERVTVVTPGEAFDVGVPVTAVGEKHAVIHPDYDRITNSGYLLDVDGTAVFHPGDALTVPEQSVDLLCLPVSAPWLKVSEAIDYALAVGAPRNLAIHDMVYSAAGLGMVDTHLGNFLRPREQEYTRLEAGTEL